MGNCQRIGFEVKNVDAIDISHFEVMVVVGRGEFGKVYRVEEKETGNFYAMKKIDKAFAMSNKRRMRTVWIERRLLAIAKHPFILNLVYAFQDKSSLYMVLPFLSGGDLRFYLNRNKYLKERDARFYLAEVLMALEYLHSMKIVYRDLKPENLLLDSEGHVLLSDFGVADRLVKQRKLKLRGETGTVGYMAPELKAKKSYQYSVDLFSFGVLAHELISGKRPFPKDADPRNTPPTISNKLSPHAKSLVEGLLEISPTKRLGCDKEGITALRTHLFFKGIDWNGMYKRKVKAPVKPEGEANFDGKENILEQLEFVEDTKAELTIEQQNKFDGFEFCNDLTIPRKIRNKKKTEDWRAYQTDRFRRKSCNSTFSKASKDVSANRLSATDFRNFKKDQGLMVTSELSHTFKSVSVQPNKDPLSDSMIQETQLDNAMSFKKNPNN